MSSQCEYLFALLTWALGAGGVSILRSVGRLQKLPDSNFSPRVPPVAYKLGWVAIKLCQQQRLVLQDTLIHIVL